MIYGSNNEFPPDIRVEKEMGALCGAGHRLTILAMRLPSDAPREEHLYAGKITIKRVPVTTMTLFTILFENFSFLEPVWSHNLKKFIKNDRPDVLHVHDLMKVPAVIRIARRYGIPVIADLHENMPAAFKVSRVGQPTLKKLAKMIVYNEYVWRCHERHSLPKCSRILVVVPEAMERLSSYGISKDKLIIVSNTEDETTFKRNSDQTDNNIIDAYRNYWTVSYIGGMGPHRGIDTTLKALPRLTEIIPNIKFLIVGPSEKHRKKIYAEALSLGIENSVEILGWQSFEKVSSYIMSSKICLVPHNDFEHTNTTVPHKLFQYMICQKPVLVSSCRPLKRIIENTGAGLVFRASDPIDLSSKIEYMYNHPQELQQMGIKGEKAALGKYAWRHDASRLINMYNQLDKELSQ